MIAVFSNQFPQSVLPTPQPFLGTDGYLLAPNPTAQSPTDDMDSATSPQAIRSATITSTTLESEPEKLNLAAPLIDEKNRTEIVKELKLGKELGLSEIDPESFVKKVEPVGVTASVPTAVS